MEINNLNNFYIYQYIDLDKNNEPFYIGKGCRYRYREIKRRNYNKYLYNKLQKLLKKYTIEEFTIFLKNDLNETQALKEEIDLIAKIGRRDLGTGSLLNLTQGGDGFDRETARKLALKRVEDGTNPLLNREAARKHAQNRVKNGTHHFLGSKINKKRLDNGTHPFLKLRKPFTIKCSDGRCWVFESKQAAIKFGFPQKALNDTISHNGQYTLYRDTHGKNNTIQFKKNNKLVLTYL